jgi:hypothetical protein
MDAVIGDRVAVVFDDVTKNQREARIIDIRDAAGTETYLVEWADNGHRQLVELGPGSHLEKRS